MLVLHFTLRKSLLLFHFVCRRTTQHQSQMMCMAPSWNMHTQAGFSKDAYKALSLSPQIMLCLDWFEDQSISTERALIGFVAHISKFRFRSLSANSHLTKYLVTIRTQRQWNWSCRPLLNTDNLPILKVPTKRKWKIVTKPQFSILVQSWKWQLTKWKGILS